MQLSKEQCIGVRNIVFKFLLK